MLEDVILPTDSVLLAVLAKPWNTPFPNRYATATATLDQAL